MFQSKSEASALVFFEGKLKLKPEIIDRIVVKYGGDETHTPRVKDRDENDPFWNFKENVKNSAGQLSIYGVTLPQYMTACARNPELFKDINVFDKISKTHKAFIPDGLTIQQVVDMHMGHANNFSQRAETKKEKFDAVIHAFSDKGLTPKQFLGAVLMEPSLLANASEKNITNIQLILDAYDDGRLTFKGKPDSRQSVRTEADWYQPAFNLICKAPATLSRSTENLRERLQEPGENSRILFDSNEALGIEPADAVARVQRERENTLAKKRKR